MRIPRMDLASIGVRGTFHIRQNVGTLRVSLRIIRRRTQVDARILARTLARFWVEVIGVDAIRAREAPDWACRSVAWGWKRASRSPAACESGGAELAGPELCAHSPTLQARIKTKNKLRIKLFYRPPMT